MDIMASFAAAALVVNGVFSVASVGVLAAAIGVKIKRPARRSRTTPCRGGAGPS